MIYSYELSFYRAWFCSKIWSPKNLQVINVNNGNNRKDNKINWIRRNFMALACFFSFSQQLETKAITRTKNTKKAFYTVTIVPRWYNMSYEMVLCITQGTKSIRISSKLCSVSIVELVTKLYSIGLRYKTTSFLSVACLKHICYILSRTGNFSKMSSVELLFTMCLLFYFWECLFRQSWECAVFKEFGCTKSR